MILTETPSTWFTSQVAIALIGGLPAILASITALVVALRSKKESTAAMQTAKEAKTVSMVAAGYAPPVSETQD